MLKRYFHSKKASIGGISGSSSSAYRIASTAWHGESGATSSAQSAPNDSFVDLSHQNIPCKGEGKGRGDAGEYEEVTGKAARFLA